MARTDQSTARDVLTQAEAQARAARVSNTHYALHLDITPRAETYRGDLTITFEDSGSGDLFLDHRGRTIERLEINGQAIEPTREPYRLILPGDRLSASNTVHIVYEHEYDHGGDGFHQFIDPEDGQEYLYTNFEPYEAHRLMPCFDQPDIKATYELTVTAPAEWELVANSTQVSDESADAGRSTRRFERTKPFSTYLFALVAGPYERFSDDLDGMPLGLLCRKSLAKYLDTDEVFEVTKQGFRFFSSFFDYPYVFGKYDQIFVPEFNAGAMENVGAITHNEYMVFRDPPTDNQRLNRAEVILHEMAHMWFGDLVTMRWWDDLWLNESFATYMAFLCLAEATRFEGAWQEFNGSIKNWAYRQDQLVTTHPIAGTVEDTDQTLLNFDGITYGKGASVLKQLAKTIGMENFRDGVRRYFRRYEYGNATLEQFLDALGEGTGQDLRAWSKLWLETASLNTIATEIETDGDRIASLALVQTAPPEYPTIRPHALDIGLLRRVDGAFDTAVVPFRIDGPRAEVEEVRGEPAPDLVVPNYGDHGYAKLALDAASVDFLRDHIGEIDDALLRQLLWSALWNMVRDQQLTSLAFLDIVERHIPSEAHTGLLDAVTGQALAALSRYVPEDRRNAAFDRFFQTSWDALAAAPPGDRQIIWMRTAIGAANVPENIARLAALADGATSFEGLTVDQDMRWDIAMKFVGHGMAGADARVAAEKERDPSDRGTRRAITCEVSRPDPEVKAAAWERFHTEEGYGSLYNTSAAMGGFNWNVQRDLLEPYVERFFERVTGVFEERDNEFARTYARMLFPGYRVERPILDRSRRLVEDLGDRLPMLVRTLREANDDLERAIRCREYAAREG